MPHQTDQPTGKSQHGVFSSVMFHHAVAFLLLTHSHGGQCQENYKIMAGIGDVVTLPCRVEPATNAVDTMLEWSRPDLDPRIVHVRRSGEDRLVDQHLSFKGRTSVSIDGLKQGDMSLRLSKVSFSDQGTYRCFIPEMKVESSVQLVVDAVIKISNVSSGVLKCESAGWNLVPEVSWLDADGKPLSAGSTESVRGSDDLYTVSSKVTVERKHGRSFTCRVTQKTINQTREAIIKVSDDFFPPHSGSNVGAVIGAIIGSGFILAIVYYVWKRHNDKKGKNVDEEERQSRSSTRSNAPEEERLLKTNAERGIVTAGKPEEKGMAHKKEDPTHPAPFRTEEETNNTASKKQSDPVGADPQSVVEDEGQQQSQVQTTSHLDNKKEEAKSVGKANPDPAEREDGSVQGNHQPPEGDRDLGAKREETKGAGQETLGQTEKIEVEGSPVDGPIESEKANQLETNKHQDNHTPAGGRKDSDLEPNKEQSTDAGKESSHSMETKKTTDDLGSSVDEPPGEKEKNNSDKDNKNISVKSTTNETAAQSLNKVETQESGPGAGGGTDSKEEEKRNKPDKSKPPPRPPRTHIVSGDAGVKPANSAPQSPVVEQRDEDDKKINAAGNVSVDQSQPAEDTAEGKTEDKINPVSQEPDPPSSTNQDTKTSTDREKSSPSGGGETGTTSEKDAGTAEQSPAGNDNTGVRNTGEGETTAPSSTSVDNCPEKQLTKENGSPTSSTNESENPTKSNAEAQDQQQVNNENMTS